MDRHPTNIALSLVGIALLSSVAWGTDFGKTRSLALEVAPHIEAGGLGLHVTWHGLDGLGDYKLQISDPAGGTSYAVIPTSAGVSSGSNNLPLFTYIDTEVELGERKEYRMVSYPTAGGLAVYGHAQGGFELPLVDSRGGIVLVVDETQAAPLETELTRLEADLHGDGWDVHREDVSPNEEPSAIKSRIVQLHATYPNVRSVFLLGDIAVPYSGHTAPDGHSTHLGAWPADCYYGDLDGVWTDTSAYATSASRSENHNVPGDGKFDQNKVYTGLELAVGRVDLAELPAFAPLTETDLLRRYLDKNHAFRQGHRQLTSRALVADQLAGLSESIGGGARRSFPAIVGRDQVEDGAWSQTISQDYLFAFGSGYGTYTSASGIGTAASCAATPSKFGFGFLFGSYFGDFDNPDNFLRSFLAAPDYNLTVCWGARPYWGVYRMALGDTIGDVMLGVFNERSSSYYSAGILQGGVHAALLGDPTLRTHTVPPAPRGSALADTNGTQLQWDLSPDSAVVGYHIYRRLPQDSTFQRLTQSLLTATTTTFLDPSGGDTSTIYMVRAIKLETTPSGSYYNASQGTYLSAISAIASPWETWKSLVFDSATDSATAGNPDGDELSNLMEYAFGTNPQEGNDLPVTLSLNESKLSYQENILASDVTFICEMSANLVDWVPTAYDSFTTEALPSNVPGTQIRKVTLNLASAPEDRCSFRIRVTLP